MRSRDYREIARNNLAGKWIPAVLAALIASLLGGLLVNGNMNLTIRISEETSFAIPHFQNYLFGFLGVSGIVGIVQLIVGGVIRQGYCLFLLKQHDGLDAQPEDLLSQFDHFGVSLGMSLLQTLYIALWSLLLVVPGIIAALRYAMAPFILLENPDMTANEALTASKHLMEGHKMELFLLNLSFIGWMLLGALTFGIGSLFVNPYMNAAYAAFYREITR